MNEINVGKVLNFTYDTDKKTLRVTIDITDEAFKEQILRNPELKDKIVFTGRGDVMRIASIKKEEV
jgi:hypothetical protein